MSIGQGSALGSAMVRRSGDTMTGHLTLEGEMRFAGAGAAPDVALQRLSANILDLATGDLLRLNGAGVQLEGAASHVFLRGGQVQMGAAGSGADVVLERGAANRLDLGAGDTLRLVAGILDLGVDVQLLRGAANRMDVASGDQLRVVNGRLFHGGVDHTTEAKTTAGTAASESVTWTTAFTNTPSTVGAAIAATAHMCTVTSRSTTGATVKSYNGGGSQQSVVKMVMAQEPS